MSSISRTEEAPMPRSSKAPRVAIASAIALGAMLAGCSDLYWDRRETVGLTSGDAVATNKVTHTIDPWPAASAQRHIAYDGERMRSAAERYRTNCVIPPVTVT